jgi:hypothetical protein
LHKQYRDWCEDAGEVPLKQRAFGDNLGERGYRSEKISSGPDKDLMGRKGIGIRTHDDPDDSSGRSSSREEEQSRTNDHDESQEDANTSSNDSVSPLSGRTEEEAPLPKNAGFAGDSSEESGGRGRSGRKIDILPLKTPTRGEDMENSSSSSSIPLRPPSGYTVVVDSAGFENYINELEDA